MEIFKKIFKLYDDPLKYIKCDQTGDIFIVDNDNYLYFDFLNQKNGFITDNDFYISNGNVKLLNIDNKNFYIESYAYPENNFSEILIKLKKHNISDELIQYILSEMLLLSKKYYYGCDIFDIDNISKYYKMQQNIENDLENLIF